MASDYSERRDRCEAAGGALAHTGDYAACECKFDPEIRIFNVHSPNANCPEVSLEWAMDNLSKHSFKWKGTGSSRDQTMSFRKIEGEEDFLNFYKNEEPRDFTNELFEGDRVMGNTSCQITVRHRRGKDYLATRCGNFLVRNIVWPIEKVYEIIIRPSGWTSWNRTIMLKEAGPLGKTWIHWWN